MSMCPATVNDSSAKVRSCPVPPLNPKTTEESTQYDLNIGAKIKEDVRQEYRKLPEKFSVATSLMRYGDVIPFVDQIMAAGRVMISVVEAVDAIGCGGKYLVEKVILKNSPDKTDLKRSYYQVSMSIARLIRADFSMGIFPFGTFTWAWINKIILLAWNVFGSLESRLVETEPGECIGDNAPAFVPLKFRKGVIFTLGNYASDSLDKLKANRAFLKNKNDKNSSEKAKQKNLFKRMGLIVLKRFPFLKEAVPEAIGSPEGSPVPDPMGTNEDDAVSDEQVDMLSNNEESDVDVDESPSYISDEELSHDETKDQTATTSPEGSQVGDMEFAEEDASIG